MSQKLTRREWNKLALTGVAGMFIIPVVESCKTSSFASGAKELGIVLGIQTYSLRDRDLSDAIKAMTQLGIKSCELWEGHVQPRNLQWKAGQTAQEAKDKAEELRKWRDGLSMEEIKAVKSQFDNAGIAIQAYNGSIKDSTTDRDIEMVFKIAEALGVHAITTSATVSVMKRVDVYAKKYKMIVAMHNHSHTDKPNEFSSPDSFARGMAGLSEYIWINLDIGHFTAAGFDAVDYLKKHHDKILCIHVKDRQKNQGGNLPFGEGDTPIKQALQLIRNNKWPIPANIEYEYKGADTIAEISRSLEYCKQAIRNG